MLPHPYIGVTGFTKPYEVQWAIDIFGDHPERLLMVGVLASHKSLRGISIKDKWAKQTPTLADIPALFMKSTKVLNLIHYSTEPDKLDDLADDLLKLEQLAGPNFHGFQLNIPWPSIGALRAIQTFRRRKTIVLQISQASMDQAGTRFADLFSRLEEYEGLAHYILLDGSGGFGKELDTDFTRRFLAAAKQADLQFGVGVAGGLGPDTLHLVEPLLKEFPDISIDAQGKLRDDEHRLVDDRVFDYLVRASDITQ